MTEVRHHQLNALIGICVLGLVAFSYQQMERIAERIERIDARLERVEDTVDQSQMASMEARLGGLEFHVRNSLYAAVPCDRPGGLCPIETDLERRATMVQQLLALGNQDLQGVNLQGVNLSGVILTDVDLTGAQLDYADLSGATLDRTDLRHASLVGANLTRASLKDALLVQADLTNAGLELANLQGAQLQAATMDGVHACNAQFGEAELGSASLEGAALWGADFRNTGSNGHFLGAHAGHDTKWDGQAPDDLTISDYEEIHGSSLAVFPSFGPEAAPFLGGNTDGTTCPHYVESGVASL